MMFLDRLHFIAQAGIIATAFGWPRVSDGESKMYGLIGKLRTHPGQRDVLIAILMGGTGRMPGCLSYIVAKDPADADGIWITEVWDSQESHKASLTLPTVKEAIAKGRPLISGFDQQIRTEPVGGLGLRQSDSSV
jgi:quinol monooxygenase YgiN